MQVVGRGQEGLMAGVQVQDLTVEVFGRSNARLSVARLLCARSPDPHRLLDLIRQTILPRRLSTLPSLNHWLHSLLVPASLKY